MSWEVIFADKRRAIGEVASVDGGRIDVFVYPEFYPRIRIGSIVVFDSEYIKPIGIVLSLLHRTRHGQITPLRKPRNEILKAYPDLDKYHRYVLTVVYTSHYSGGKIYHYRGGMPRLHDLVFLVDGHDLLDEFFRPEGSWNFDFLRYYVSGGATELEVREFLLTHKEYFLRHKSDLDDIISKLVDSLYKSRVPRMSLILEELSTIFYT